MGNTFLPLQPTIASYPFPLPSKSRMFMRVSAT